LGSSSRRAKGSIFVICDHWRNAQDGPKDKQDCGFISFHGPKTDRQGEHERMNRCPIMKKENGSGIFTAVF
jgi:hypothetical protein